MKIVEFKKEDQDKVFTFINEVYREFDWQHPRGHEDFWTYFRIPNGGLFLLAKENNKIIGTAGLRKLKNGDGLILRFYVDKNYRGKGIAQLLYEGVLKKSKELGLGKFVLDTNVGNDRAEAFYKKLGFVKYKPEASDEWPATSNPSRTCYFKLT